MAAYGFQLQVIPGRLLWMKLAVKVFDTSRSHQDVQRPVRGLLVAGNEMRCSQVYRKVLRNFGLEIGAHNHGFDHEVA